MPRAEPLHRFANRPYTVLGRDYVPATSLRPYRERGVASWYGRKFHGQKTSTGEIYDMYAMTAAHPTLPLPSYARVTNPATGVSVVVRVNDRGPFLHGRVIDLSFAAAHKLGIAQRGSGEVEVEAVLPGEATLLAPATLPPVGAGAAAPTGAGVVTRRSRPRHRWRPRRRPPCRRSAPRRSSSRRRAPDSRPRFRPAATSSSSARSATTPTRSRFSPTRRRSSRPRRSRPRSARPTGSTASTSAPIADRAVALRNAERIERAFGMPTAVAPH